MKIAPSTFSTCDLSAAHLLVICILEVRTGHKSSEQHQAPVFAPAFPSTWGKMQGLMQYRDLELLHWGLNRRQQCCDESLPGLPRTSFFHK